MTTDMAADHGLDPELISWIERITRGRVRGVRRMARWRPNYFVDVETLQGPTSLFLKGPRVPLDLQRRSRMLSGYGTRREAAALAALRGGPVPVPEYHGFLAERGTLLMGSTPGSGMLQALPVSQRRTAMLDYARCLADIHAVDPARLGELAALDAEQDPTPGRPGPLAAVLADHEVLRRRFDRPDPLLELAVRWLERRTPVGRERVLLHGDAGPNQFLVERGSVVAVIDWEVSHLGDPLSDLGYARFRESLYPSGAYPEFVTEYVRASARPLDREVLDFYTVVGALLMLAGISGDVHRPSHRNPESLQHFWWDALARVAICQVLGETLGLPPLELRPHERHPTTTGALSGLLAGRITRDGDAGKAPGGAAHSLLLARALARADELRLEEREQEQTAALLGRKIVDPVERAVAVSTVLDEKPLEDLVGYFGSLSLIRLDAMSPLAATDVWERPEPARSSLENALDGDEDGRLVGQLLPAVPEA